MGVVAPPQAPPFPFTVEQFVAEVSPPSAAATASQACAAFAQLATKVVVPGTFRAAVPAVLGLVAREGEGLLEAKESVLSQDPSSLALLVSRYLPRLRKGGGRGEGGGGRAFKTPQATRAWQRLPLFSS